MFLISLCRVRMIDRFARNLALYTDDVETLYTASEIASSIDRRARSWIYGFVSEKYTGYANC